jgi:hypothetical protein
MSKTLRTLSRDQYKALIEEAVASRRAALAEITAVTLRDFRDEEVLALGKKALASYEELITLKKQMREDYPAPTCVCSCHPSEVIKE